MRPRLVALGGPLEGDTIALERVVVTIGRHADCTVRLAKLAISRRHCEIRRTEHSHEIVDLDSRRGTFVNTRPVRQRRLDHGDLIQIGDTSFLFLRDESSDSGSAPALHVTSELAAASTVEISTAAAEEREVKALSSRILDLLLPAVSADRACILVFEPGSERPLSGWFASQQQTSLQTR